MNLKQKEGVLLLQLGSPKSLTVKSVREYLLSFLGDPNTLGNPPFFWQPLLRYVIAPSRAKKSALKYQEMCENAGVTEMPLITYTREFTAGVQRELKDCAIVLHAYQHGASPSIKEALEKFLALGVSSVRAVPLYPQRSGATSMAALNQLKQELHRFPSLSVSASNGFADHPAWVKNIADSIRPYQDDSSTILVSWHGMQKKRIALGDPYEADCRRSILALENALGVSLKVSYQSKFGLGKWLSPSTLQMLKELGRARAKVVVVCPAFTVDNLETLHEIDIEAKEAFFKAGGVHWKRVPCLNTSPKWIYDFAHQIALELPCQKL